MGKLSTIKDILKWFAIYSATIGIMLCYIFADMYGLVACGFFLIAAIIMDFD